MRRMMVIAIILAVISGCVHQSNVTVKDGMVTTRQPGVIEAVATGVAKMLVGETRTETVAQYEQRIRLENEAEVRENTYYRTYNPPVVYPFPFWVGNTNAYNYNPGFQMFIGRHPHRYRY